LKIRLVASKSLDRMYRKGNAVRGDTVTLGEKEQSEMCFQRKNAIIGPPGPPSGDGGWKGFAEKRPIKTKNTGTAL